MSDVRRHKPYRYSSDCYRKVKKARFLKEQNVVSHNEKYVSIKRDPRDPRVQEETFLNDNLINNIETFPGGFSQGQEDAFEDNNYFDFNNTEECIFDEHDFEEKQKLENNLSLVNDLMQWALSHRLSIISVTNLLKILRRHGLTTLPADGRTLLQTPERVEIENMGAGSFWFFGVKCNLLRVLTDIHQPSSFSLLINIDGMSPFNSSTLQFWPILFTISEMPYLQPMVAGVYYGDSKPPLQLYFRRFVDELNEIMTEGLILNGHEVTVKVKCFVCDTPARAFIKGTPGANAEYGSCIKCTVVGEWDKKGRHMSYPRTNCERRSDESFRKESDEDHHKEHTPLTELAIDMVKDFVVADSLHLFDLGIMRKCLFGWREGNYNFRTKLSKAQADSLSDMLVSCNATKPMDIQRAIRNLKYLKHWKGSEYRTFLLYLGPVVLKDFLTREVYEHFLLLNSAVTILSCSFYLNKYINVAETLLDRYIEKFIDLYGIDSISSNVHNLCHVVEDVKNFGPLPAISSYKFENFLGYLKSLVRSGKLPLSQVAKRIVELTKLENSKSPKEQVYVTHKILGQDHEMSRCKNVYTKIHLTKEFVLTNDSKNKYFMTKANEIVLMLNATFFNNKIHIYGASVQNKYDFFSSPFASSQLNIYASVGEKKAGGEGLKCKTDKPRLFSLDQIKCKLFCLPHHNEFVFFPLIHTLDANIKL